MVWLVNMGPCLRQKGSKVKDRIVDATMVENLTVTLARMGTRIHIPNGIRALKLHDCPSRVVSTMSMLAEQLFHSS